jgi:hypothetical protein
MINDSVTFFFNNKANIPIVVVPVAKKYCSGDQKASDKREKKEGVCTREKDH